MSAGRFAALGLGVALALGLAMVVVAVRAADEQGTAEQAAPAVPPVYVYHEPGGAGHAYFDPPKALEPEFFHRRMAEVLVEALRGAGVEASVADARTWLRLCRARERGVVVDLAQYPVEELYGGEDEGSPVEEWLDAGGVMIYAGDWPFHWYVGPDGALKGEGACSQGDDDIFDADLVRDGFVGIAVGPTEEGKRWLPSLRAEGTLRPFDADAVARHCPWYELYSVGTRPDAEGKVLRAADALCFRLPSGDGFFAAFHLRRGSHTDSNQVVYEFITRRLAGVLAEGGRPR